MANQLEISSSTNKQQVFVIFLASLVSLVLVATQTNALEPMVETGVSALSPEGKHVGVNVPPFFHMVLDTRGPGGKGLRMSQSVMSGLVKINLDREKGADGKIRGPIEVKVGGVTMYNNHEAPPEDSTGENSTENSTDENSSTENSQDDTDGNSSESQMSRLSRFGQQLGSMF